MMTTHADRPMYSHYRDTHTRADSNLLLELEQAPPITAALDDEDAPF